jgi:hypothetical protein
MHNLKEDLLQFIWQYKLLKPSPLITRSGKEIAILNPGELNKDSGPDFFNARIRINDIILAGNIEVHIRSSDWMRHNHQDDKSYDNLILHVVYHYDKEVHQNKKNNVEVLEIKDLVSQNLLKDYSTLIDSKQPLACANQLGSINDLKFNVWLQRMFVERLEYKLDWITNAFESFEGNYSQTFYVLLLRNFGFKVNSVPFELLARQLPLTTLLKHSDNLIQLESLLFGMGGLLDEQFSDDYILKLQNEFEYLKNKYRLTPLKKELFKFSKLRPANFATLRLAQLARLIHVHPEMFQAPHLFNSFEKIEACFSMEPEGYWKNHYMPDGKAVDKALKFGHDSVSNIIINTFAPFFFFYYKKTGLSELTNTPFELMERCSFEKNAKTGIFSAKKNLFKNASDSQALIHLLDNYCTKRKCLKCGVAAAILKSP